MNTKYRSFIFSNTTYRKKRGNALLLVVILFMVISILSLAMLAVANTEHTQVLAEEKIDQAYYVARAAAQATADWISANFNARDQMNKVVPKRVADRTAGDPSVTTQTGTLDGATYSLTIWRHAVPDEDLIYIEAAAEYMGYPAKAQISLREAITTGHYFDDAIYAIGAITDIDGGGNGSNTIIGSVATAADYINPNLNTVPTPNNYTYQKVLSFWTKTPDYNIFSFKVADEIIFSPKPNQDPPIINVPPYTGTGNLNAQFTDLTLDGEIRIDNSTDPNAIVHICVDNLTIKSASTITPMYPYGGRIFIYVMGTISCDKEFSIGGNSDNPLTYLVCNGGGTINFSGNSTICAFVYGPFIDIKLGGGGGQVNVYGALIANIYGHNGNLKITWREPNLEGTVLDVDQDIVTISYLTWYNK